MCFTTFYVSFAYLIAKCSMTYYDVNEDYFTYLISECFTAYMSKLRFPDFQMFNDILCVKLCLPDTRMF